MGAPPRVRPGARLPHATDPHPGGNPSPGAALVPGRYTLTPEDVLDSGVRFPGQASPPSPSVQAAETATASVSYVPVSARLTANLRAERANSPLPGSGSPGQGGFNRLLDLLRELLLGQTSPLVATPSASPMWSGTGSTPTPLPPSRAVDLQAGERKAVDISYAPTTGAVRSGRCRGCPPGLPAVSAGGTSLPPVPLPLHEAGGHGSPTWPPEDTPWRPDRCPTGVRLPALPLHGEPGG